MSRSYLEGLLEQRQQPRKTVSCRLPVQVLNGLDEFLAAAGLRRAEFVEAAVMDAYHTLAKKVAPADGGE